MITLIVYYALNHHYYLLECSIYQPLYVSFNNLFNALDSNLKIHPTSRCFDQIHCQAINMFQTPVQLQLIQHQLLIII